MRDRTGGAHEMLHPGFICDPPLCSFSQSLLTQERHSRHFEPERHSRFTPMNGHIKR